MNRTVLIGRLTKDPELKYTPGTGNAVATFTLAVDRQFKNKEGQKEVDFIPIVVWGKPAENAANYLSKGKLIGVSGRIQTRSYDAKDGSKRYVTEVVADEVQFLEWGNNSTSNGQTENHDSNNSYLEEVPILSEDDIPF